MTAPPQTWRQRSRARLCDAYGLIFPVDPVGAYCNRPHQSKRIAADVSSPPMPDSEIPEIVARALAEDLGSGDVTTAATVAPETRARALITQKRPGVVFGLDAAEASFTALDPEVSVRRLAAEGVWREGGPVLEVEGRARALLSAERTALNFLQRLSGVATLAARCVAAVEGTGAQILDTRKTTPGLRALEKAAVAAGGATNHRAGLFDMVMVKDNHLAAGTTPDEIQSVIHRAKTANPALRIEIEADTIAQAKLFFQLAGVDVVLLDN